MINIDTHQIIDLIDSRQEEDVAEWLSSYPNLEVISRDGGIMYKSASDKSHPKAIQISDRFHILKNLTEYAKSALQRILERQVKIEDDSDITVSSKSKKKYEFKNKWNLILKVKELKEKNYRVIDIAQYLGISEKSVVKYSKISIKDKEKYIKISANELKSQVSQKNKWQLIQEVQKEYKKYHKYSIVARKFNLCERTAKNYLKINKPPINGNKSKQHIGKLEKHKSKIIKMNNDGCKWNIIFESIKKDGYSGGESLLRTYYLPFTNGIVLNCCFTAMSQVNNKEK